MTKEIEYILQLFKDKPFLIRMGVNRIAEQEHLVVSDILAARKIYWERLGKKSRNRKSKNTLFNSKLPKILVLDIETAPLKAFVWSRWKQNIYLEQTISEWFMLTWAAKWLYSSEILSDKVTPEEVLVEDDKRIVTSLWKLLDEADIVITHNGEKFDLPKCNSRFILAGLPPVSPYQSIDTKKVSAKQFGFSSNKLDALAGYFNIRHKDDTDFDLWVRCLQGEQEALNYMEFYNKHDVEILEEVYLKLRPWILGHPNLGLYTDSNGKVCGHCGSDKINKVGNYFTKVGRYDLYRCNCGALSRVRTTNLDKDKRKELLTNL